MRVFTCGIVEDEELARALITKYVQRYNQLRLAWCIESLSDTVDKQQTPSVDLVFLDLLDKPNDSYRIGDGVRVNADQFQNVIITTAYPESFVQSLGIRYLKVLTKPFTYPMFEQVVTQALALLKQ
ncbi:response regulator [Hymenobacter perfusus]|uniref:Response regulator n=1 Tax=Hymenobacter perfusus TaxID=1236770 RepID=A0A3R9NAK1_9BACT|nr:response regulator [Hymenobacter perfusus]RSK42771.1 response regulator [Hymenobacter perfusus]